MVWKKNEFIRLYVDLLKLLFFAYSVDHGEETEND